MPLQATKVYKSIRFTRRERKWLRRANKGVIREMTYKGEKWGCKARNGRSRGVGQGRGKQGSESQIKAFKSKRKRPITGWCEWSVLFELFQLI